MLLYTEDIVAILDISPLIKRVGLNRAMEIRNKEKERYLDIYEEMDEFDDPLVIVDCLDIYMRLEKLTKECGAP